MGFKSRIAEMQKLIEASPDDVRLRQKLGELYQKANKASDAAACFAFVAESYARDRFFLKAVALMKQVLRIDPKHVDAHGRLADWYEHLGLLSEAVAHLRALAAHQQASGNAEGLAQTLERIQKLGGRPVVSPEGVV